MTRNPVALSSLGLHIELLLQMQMQMQHLNRISAFSLASRGFSGLAAFCLHLLCALCVLCSGNTSAGCRMLNAGLTASMLCLLSDSCAVCKLNEVQIYYLLIDLSTKWTTARARTEISAEWGRTEFLQGRQLIYLSVRMRECVCECVCVA